MWTPVAKAREVLPLVETGSEESRAYEPHIDVDCAKIARQVRHSGRRTIGLLPSARDMRRAASDGSLAAFATELAFAIGVLTQEPILILDPEQIVGGPLGEAQGARADAAFFMRVPAASVGVIAPRSVAPAGAKFEMVKLLVQFIASFRESVGHVLIDLSGCQLPGELTGALGLLEGIMLVGRAGDVDEATLARSSRMVPPHLNLGVVLTAPEK